MKNIVYFTISKIEYLKDFELKTETEFAKKLLKNMMKQLNIDFDNIVYSENGKPYFENLKIFFNYSHSTNFIACAVSDFEVGIDIEEKGREIGDRLSERFLGNEKNMEKRLEKWVKKEAFSKMKGLGFQIGFKNLDLDKVSEKDIFLERDDYIVSIFSENQDTIFEELYLDGI